MEPAVRENPTDLSEASSDLTWSKMGMRSLYRECIDLCAFFTHVAEQTPVLLKDNAVRFIFDLDPTLGKIDTDPTRLLRIIENLLTNAITFTPTGEMLFMVRPVQRDDGR